MWFFFLRNLWFFDLNILSIFNCWIPLVEYKTQLYHIDWNYKNESKISKYSEKLTHLGINILLGFSQTQIPPATWDLLANIHKLWIVLAFRQWYRQQQNYILRGSKIIFQAIFTEKAWSITTSICSSWQLWPPFCS